MPKFAAVLFDLFDTLCHIDERVYRDGKRREADTMGLAHEPFMRAWVESGDLAQVGLLADVPARVRHVNAALGGREPSAAILDQVIAIEMDTLRAATMLHPDARPVLEDLRARPGLGVGLVSNASSAAPDLFGHLGLAPYFDATAWSFKVGVAKPEAAIYIEACRALDVSPAACLFVGDGNSRELDGARALGMTAVRIERVFSLAPYRREQSRSFDASIGDLRRLPALFAADLPAS